MRYLSRQQVEETGISMAEMIEVVEAMFRDKGHGRVEMPPKPGIHTRPDAFIHAMPAYLPGAGAAGMKWISGYPANQARGLPYISGLMILNDDDTGIPQLNTQVGEQGLHRAAAAQRPRPRCGSG